MAQARPLFSSLQDATGDGIPLHRVLEGDPAAAKNASAALVAVDPSDNLKYLETNAAGSLQVVVDSGVAFLRDSALVAGNLALTTVATIVAAASKTYRVKAQANNFRDTVYEVLMIDDVGTTDVETNIGYIYCSAGDVSSDLNITGNEVTSGAVGVINIIVRGINLQKASDFTATITAEEVQ